jgi:hypothetical protein
MLSNTYYWVVYVSNPLLHPFGSVSVTAVKYGVIIVTDSGVAKTEVSIPAHAIGQNSEPFSPIYQYSAYYDIYLTAVGLTPGGSSTVHRIQRSEHT